MKHSDKCMSCGGPVDAHGMAHGGSVEEDGDYNGGGSRENQDGDDMYDAGDVPPNDENMSSQMAESEDMESKARRNFIRAVRRGR